MKKVLTIIILLAAAFFIAVELVGKNGGRGVIYGKLPEFVLPSTKGYRIGSSYLRGKVTIINFWATWCPPCVEEMPALQKLDDSIRSEKSEVILVNTEQGRDSMEIEGWLRSRGITLESLQDSEGKLQSQLDVRAYPTTFIVDKNLNIRDVIVGPRDWDNPEYISKMRKFVKDNR